MQGIPVEVEDYGLVAAILNENYSDGIDRIESAYAMPDGSLQAIVWDAGMQFVANIGETVELCMINETTQPTAQFAEAKARKCNAGVTCGGSCIAKGKTCNKKASDSQKEKTSAVVQSTKKPLSEKQQALADSRGKDKDRKAKMKEALSDKGLIKSLGGQKAAEKAASEAPSPTERLTKALEKKASDKARETKDVKNAKARDARAAATTKKGTNPEISSGAKDLVDSLRAGKKLSDDVKATKASGGKTIGDLQNELKRKNKADVEINGKEARARMAARLTSRRIAGEAEHARMVPVRAAQKASAEATIARGEAATALENAVKQAKRERANRK